MLRASVVERIEGELEGLDPLVRCCGAYSDRAWGRGAVFGVPRPRCTARARAVARLAWLFAWMPDRRSESMFSAECAASSRRGAASAARARRNDIHL